MQKILFLDWDGPVSNTRTWRMPGFVDPVAIKLLNDAMQVGWRVVLSSTIRKDFNTVEEATTFMKTVGFDVQWHSVWRTDPHYTNRRHIEIANHLSANEYEDDAIFLVVDDEHMPIEMQEHGRMIQLVASTHAGLDYLNISSAYAIFDMNDVRLDEEFGNGNHV